MITIEKAYLFIILAILYMAFPLYVNADCGNINPTEVETIGDYTPCDWFYVDNSSADDIVEEVPEFGLKGIGVPHVSATRESSTKLNYTYKVNVAPTADKATVKIWKCVYSSSQNKWVNSGSAKVTTLTKVSGIKLRGGFNVSAGNKYKIKAYIIETRNGVSHNKTAWSSAV